MAAFLTLAAAEARCKSQVAAKVWLVAHSERDANGVIKARFIRYMTTAGLSEAGRGGWQETDQDNVD